MTDFNPQGLKKVLKTIKIKKKMIISLQKVLNKPNLILWLNLLKHLHHSL